MNEEGRALIEFSPVTEPSYYSCTILPDNDKKLFLNKIDEFKNVINNIGVDKSIQKDIINKLNTVYEFSISNSHNDIEYKKFKSITKQLDIIRNEDFELINKKEII
jgi:hypothetical protein